MARWLVKTDPRIFGWPEMVRAGTVAWVGVRSPLALRHLAAFGRGDEVLVYHSVRCEVVGLATVVRAPYPDGRSGEAGRPIVDLAARAVLEPPVSRRVLAARPELVDWELVAIPRLTVLPVPEAAWRALRQVTRVRNIRAGARARR